MTSETDLKQLPKQRVLIRLGLVCSENQETGMVDIQEFANLQFLMISLRSEFRMWLNERVEGGT